MAQAEAAIPGPGAGPLGAVAAGELESVAVQGLVSPQNYILISLCHGAQPELGSSPRILARATRSVAGFRRPSCRNGRRYRQLARPEGQREGGHPAEARRRSSSSFRCSRRSSSSPSFVRRPRVTSRMWWAWTSENCKLPPVRRRQASTRSELCSIAASTSPRFSKARRSPSTISSRRRMASGGLSLIVGSMSQSELLLVVSRRIRAARRGVRR
jgi:hypothetical protein